MSDLRQILGGKIRALLDDPEPAFRALDVVDEQDDSAIVTIEIISGNVISDEPAVTHRWTLRVVGGEWQGETYETRR